MSAAPIIPDLPGRAVAPLRARRCVRHVEREAVARCSTCGGFYCRECVVDHGGRLVCARCLAKTSAAAVAKPKPRMTALWRGLTFVAAMMMLWALFSTVGSLLLSVPAEFHEGTIWRRIGAE